MKAGIVRRVYEGKNHDLDKWLQKCVLLMNVSFPMSEKESDIVVL